MIPANPRLPQADSPTFIPRLFELLGLHANEINKATKFGTAAPTTKPHRQGEFYWNETPTELGTAGNKYVVLGWSCVTTGEPGTWVQCRCLTGN